MGWKGESRRHSLSRKGIKTNNKYARIVDGEYQPTPEERRSLARQFSSRGYNENIEAFKIGGRYWGIKFDPNGKVNHVFELDLGNLSDAGWYWDGGESDLILFLSRINQNKEVRKEFLEQINEIGLKPKDIEDYLHDAIVEEDSLYALSGDNAIWKHSDDPRIDVYYEITETSVKYDLTDEQKEKLEEKFFDTLGGINYSDFNKEYGDDLRKELKNKILESDSFEDLLIELKDIQETARENTDELIRNQEYEAYSKAENEVLTKLGIDRNKPMKASGWNDKLHNVYSNFDEWKAYSETYGLHRKLGFDSPKEAWENNPHVKGGVNPAEYGLYKPKSQSGVKGAN